MTDFSLADQIRLIEYIRSESLPFVRAENLQGEVSFKSPNEVYIPAKRLKIYFKDSLNTWFLSSDDYTQEDSNFNSFWDILGVSRIVKCQHSINSDQKTIKQYVDKPENSNYLTPVVQFELIHYSNALSIIKNNNIDFSDRKEVSVSLWQALRSNLNNVSYYDIDGIKCKFSIHGQYFWFFRKFHNKPCGSKMYNDLMETPWLPTTNGEFKRPSEVYISGLDPTLEATESNSSGLIEELGIRKTDGIDEILAAFLHNGSNVPPEMIVLLLQVGATEDGKIRMQQWMRELKQSEAVDLPTSHVPNPERRERKLQQAYQDASDIERIESVRSVRVHNSDIKRRARAKLRKYYTTKDTMYCQICRKRMPFNLPDDQGPYFEAVEILPKLKKENQEVYLALCPVCSAKYQIFMKNDDEKCRQFQNRICTMPTPLQDVRMNVTLGDEQTEIFFTETHFFDIQKILKEERDASASDAQ